MHKPSLERHVPCPEHALLHALAETVPQSLPSKPLSQMHMPPSVHVPLPLQELAHTASTFVAQSYPPQPALHVHEHVADAPVRTPYVSTLVSSVTTESRPAWPWASKTRTRRVVLTRRGVPQMHRPCPEQKEGHPVGAESFGGAGVKSVHLGPAKLAEHTHMPAAAAVPAMHFPLPPHPPAHATCTGSPAAAALGSRTAAKRSLAHNAIVRVHNASK